MICIKMRQLKGWILIIATILGLIWICAKAFAAASYPTSLKSYTDKVDNVDDVMAADVNSLQDEVVAIETALGAGFSGANQTIKGWINLNGTGVIAIADSYNVSGITDNGTGNYTVTWDTDFGSANYAAVCSALNTGGGADTTCSPSTKLAGSLIVYTFASATGNAADSADISVIAIGDR
jgi:hypothetical protein